ncbi:hypothetical protein DICPUDRAFT_157185 [Dictyostelium purpureum]|uniref:Enoyl-CoA hydratase n=1 Tax=Dictyostelium purpureum TaxID=5786 RepID=F0ZYH2_DICPU|nr:uncharacterized protein DICPUDRAFT_157185 [Dictyostelium purpureum]EGC31003.1 hypothetical protein DICPUDRAFT_157185 [Dictyostelium purpureum]|eukprot:XP_003292473.1 hypothetical protein DICPUDRAFT_157185 [Dictyostelium purpureum]
MKWINKKEFGNFYVEQLESNEDIFLLTLNDNENRFNDNNIKYFHQSLDYVESCENASCLISTSTSPKFYSLGLDLDWVLPLGKEKFETFVYDFHALLQRLLVFPIPTICCINGHSFAGGAMFSMAHDWRIMKDDRGFFCLPEINIHIPLTPGMNAILQNKITNAITYRDVVLTGKRYGGKEAAKLQIVDKACQDILEESVKLAELVHGKGKDRVTYQCLKLEMYKNVSANLLEKSIGYSSKALAKL